MIYTNHKLICADSRNMAGIPSRSVQLIVTSPPYPMINIWDNMFASLNPNIDPSFINHFPDMAYKEMHKVLNKVWDECDRVLEDNCFICINIGDAVRTINGHFAMYPNHMQVTEYFRKKGYTMLPDILWRKPTNSPNKFMGSGMYPAGAYVTYEHEYILIFRKGENRQFEDKQNRHESAYFWEERNTWFSDLWEIRGTSQSISNDNENRPRNAAYPFEIPYRLVNMYSVKGDTVLDPFCGTGTTNLACMASERNSIGIDIDEKILNEAVQKSILSTDRLNKRIEKRLNDHAQYMNSLPEEKINNCYINKYHKYQVKTKQETEMRINLIENIYQIQNQREIQCKYI